MNLNKLKDAFPIVIIEEETVPKILLKYIEHHRYHYLTLKFLGKEIHPCARCFGYWVGLLIGFFLFSPFWSGFIHTDDFLLVFSASWVLAAPSLIDWSTVKLGLRKGNNNIRAFVGFLHGISTVMYFLVLPAGILFKVVTYTLYAVVFNLTRWTYHARHFISAKNKSLKG